MLSSAINVIVESAFSHIFSLPLTLLKTKNIIGVRERIRSFVQLLRCPYAITLEKVTSRVVVLISDAASFAYVHYISKIECLMGIALDRSKEAVAGALTAAKQLEEELYNEVKKKEGRSYDFHGNEMQLLASLIWSAYVGWFFEAKSEDPSRQDESR